MSNMEPTGVRGVDDGTVVVQRRVVNADGTPVAGARGAWSSLPMFATVSQRIEKREFVLLSRAVAAEQALEEVREDRDVAVMDCDELRAELGAAERSRDRLVAQVTTLTEERDEARAQAEGYRTAYNEVSPLASGNKDLLAWEER